MEHLCQQKRLTNVNVNAMENRLATYQRISKDWEYNPMADRFIYQRGVFTVTRYLAMQTLKSFGKDKYPNAWILDALNHLLKERL